ncbi:MAG: nucleoside phosphorylase [Oscillospiraceae bacterium]|nr:nucleoside phosphorylase [Oscillospiraceae bacterium]
MITETFDNKSKAIINPTINENAPAVDACILTFSEKIEKFVTENYDCKQIDTFRFATGDTPVYQLEYAGKKVAFYKTYVGAPACVGTVEDSLSVIKTKNYVVFGGAGCLDKEIAHGKIMIPTEAYRDEGTSYHYMPASDYVTVKNSDIVAEFMSKNGIPYVKGKTWTTDSFYRETVNNFKKHKADGCISVEMECAGLQAMCDFRGLELYTFFTSADLLDAPEWDKRHKKGEIKGTQHDAGHFDIALELAVYVAERE